MTNKELAVQLYCASLQATATVASNPNFHQTVQIPTNDKMVDEVEKLAEMLSRIEDK